MLDKPKKKKPPVRLERLIPCKPYWVWDEYGNGILMKVRVEYYYYARK